jgi:MarR family transcriptional regulator, temperature-dependent positive regulator of motility
MPPTRRARSVTQDATRRRDSATSPAGTATAPAVHRVAAHLARRFHQVCLGVLSEVTEPEGLTPLEFAALASIDEAPGIDQRRLATRLAIDAVSAGQIVSALERNGLVERRVDPADRRARRLTLTRRGVRVRAHLRPLLLAAHDRILAPVSLRERAMLVDLLARVIEGNEPYARPGNGRRRPQQRLIAESG